MSAVRPHGVDSTYLQEHTFAVVVLDAQRQDVLFVQRSHRPTIGKKWVVVASFQENTRTPGNGFFAFDGMFAGLEANSRQVGVVEIAAHEGIAGTVNRNATSATIGRQVKPLVSRSARNILAQRAIPAIELGSVITKRRSASS